MSKDLSPEVKNLIDQYGLNSDPNDPWSDVFISPRFKIITRTGIDKIAAKAKIETVDLDPLLIDPYEVVYKGTYRDAEGRTVTTTATASIDRFEFIKTSKKAVKPINVNKDNDDFEDLWMETSREEEGFEKVLLKKGNVMQNPPYLSEMAEKRCNSRGILKLSGFYDLGIYGEDEADDFSNEIKKRRYGSNSKPKEEQAKVSSKTIR